MNALYAARPRWVWKQKGHLAAFRRVKNSSSSKPLSGKTKDQDTRNITTATLHMDTRLQHVIVTVFKTQPHQKKKKKIKLLACWTLNIWMSFITQELNHPQFKCLISALAISPWGLGLHPLYELQAVANQPVFFPNPSQESSHLEQQRPLCAFHTGSEKENTRWQRVHVAATQQYEVGQNC